MQRYLSYHMFLFFHFFIQSFFGHLRDVTPLLWQATAKLLIVTSIAHEVLMLVLSIDTYQHPGIKTSEPDFLSKM